MSVLYRKYRPQSFADVVGQPHITTTLIAALTHDRVAHAYLFSGPRGVGKTTTARLLAKAVNCTQRSASGSGEPCNVCASCCVITEGRCLDVVEIDAASHTGVDHVREQVIDHARVAAVQAQRKVFIIDEVHMLSTSAFNALLKTLEEPPPNVLFILATTESHRLPETIRSRCQQFVFRRVSSEVLAERLAALAHAEGVVVDAEVIASIIRAADGSVRDAESCMGQLLALGGERITAEDAAFVLPRSNAESARALMGFALAGDLPQMLAELDRAESDGSDPEAYVRDGIVVLREWVREAIRSTDRARAARATCLLRACLALVDGIGRVDRPFFVFEVGLLDAVLGSEATAPVTSAVAGVGKPMTRSAAPQSPSSSPSVLPPPTAVESAPPVTRTPVPPSAPEMETHPIAIPETPPQTTPAATMDVPPVPSDALDRLRTGWSVLLAQLAEVNRSLPYLLEGGRPQRLEGDVLTIGFRYRLHAEKARQPVAIDAITRAVHAMIGSPVRVVLDVISTEEFAALESVTRAQTGDVVADAALEVFGGRVVE
ncbi:DNA polymerase III subunit gamma/tau [Candidatus Uhrbacteria bacterium]|nr:DNA polymerase III subunit gamma/tau [Candidatus Uhrbacteria bacterium]